MSAKRKPLFYFVHAAALLGVSLLCVATVQAEGETPEAQHVVRGAEVFGDEVVPFKFFGDIRDLPKVESWEPGDPLPINPRRWTGEPEQMGFTPATPDPLLDVQRGAARGTAQTTQSFSFEGLDNGAQPPDPTGDIGKNYYIQSVNASSFAIYDKTTGNMVAGPTAMDSLGTGSCASGAGDPIIIYDSLAERWVMSEFTFNNDMCVYVSMTDDPVSGGWCNYEFTAPQFPDYPKYSMWPDAYLVTSNEGGNVPVYALDRENMITCGTARPFQRLTAPRLPGLGFQAFTPVDANGATAPPAGADALLMRHRDTELGNQGPALPTTDVLEMWALDIDWNTPGNSTLSQLPNIEISEFDSNLCPPLSIFSCIPQPGTSTRLDPLVEVIMFALGYRNFGTHESIVGVLQTDIGDFEDHSGERWFELRRTTGAGGAWSLYQEGTYSPDADHRFMGAISQDGDGNILLAYALSSDTVNPSVRYTGRLSSDPLGTMTEPETSLVAGTGFNSSIRYGDYSQMGVDPVDECTFWMTVEYTEGNGNNTTRIGAVKFDQCSGGLSDDIFADDYESGNLSAWSVTVGGL